MKLGYKTAWLLLLLSVVSAFALVFVPAYLIQPFAAQSARAVEVSYLFKSWSPFVTLVLALFALALSIFVWMRSKRWLGKAALIVPLFLIAIFTWFARQNHFEWMFNPLGQTQFARADKIDFLSDSEMVLAVKVNGEAVAYPVTLMGYHHIAQDVVGGIPITATY
jgi:hypothetical protein